MKVPTIIADHDVQIQCDECHTRPAFWILTIDPEFKSATTKLIMCSHCTAVAIQRIAEIIEGTTTELNEVIHTDHLHTGARIRDRKVK